MDFLGIIQWVMDVQQYPESHKEEIERLKDECQNLSNLIKMIGQDCLPPELKGQIKRNLGEAEELLKKVPRKAGVIQSFINMLPGQQVLQKLKDASDSIHRTVNNLNTFMNCRIFSKTNTLSAANSADELLKSINPSTEFSDLRSTQVKKLNSSDNTVTSSGDNITNFERKQTSLPEVQATLVDPLDPTLENNDEDDEDEEGLFGGSKKNPIKQLTVTLDLENIMNAHIFFEQNTINTRETFNLPSNVSAKSVFIFQRQTYHVLSETFKDVNRISREHAAIDYLTFPLKRDANASQQIIQPTPAKEEECFATCAETLDENNEDEEEHFVIPKQVVVVNQVNHLVIRCIGANGLSVYRKSENQEKEREITDEELKKQAVKKIQPGSWVEVAKNESVLLFNNDSIGLLRKDKIAIVYTVKLKHTPEDTH